MSSQNGRVERDGKAGQGAVEALLHFQQTGQGFDRFWNEAGPLVAEFARRNLRKLGVRVRCSAGEGPVGEVVNCTVQKLLELGLPGAGGRFDLSKTKRPGMAAMRAWLNRVVQHHAVTWLRDERGSRSVKILPDSSLDWNTLREHEDGRSLVNRTVAKIERADLLPILEECINRLPDPLMQEMVRLKLDEGVTVRQTADRLGIHVSSVQRCLTKAYALLRPMLDERGMDGEWLAA